MYENRVTFRTWILSNKIDKDTPVGDLARDIQRDINFPSTYEYSEMIGYLNYKRACFEAKEAFRHAYKQYYRYLTRKQLVEY